ncbi:MAG: hypothetical protein M3N46_03890 [Actinomycetota bacterium]|nr:hypothetical protein [Actinomycetota bacterium]
MSDVTPSKAEKTPEEPVDAPLDETPETPAEAATAAAAAHEPVPAEHVATEPVAAEPVAAEHVAADPVAAEPAHTPVVEPAHTPELIEPEPVPADTAAVRSAVAEPAVAQPVAAPQPIAEATPVVVPAAVAATSAVPAQQMVYVAPPVPPKKRGNRGIGVLLSFVGGLLFAGVYVVVSAVILDLREGDLFGPDFVSFVSSAFFWVPIATFLVGMILLVLMLNRAGWWAHVFGSLILAIAVYFGMIGLLLLIGNVFHASSTVVTFAALAVNPWVIAAAVVAREVSIWTGLGIAARGRRVKARNVEERAAFDREQEATRAEYAGTPAGV